MARIYKSICNEADTLHVKISHLVQQEIELKMEMEKLMNKGFVKIAKARYIMGSTCVTKMQLPTENSNPIRPIATVYRTESENKWIFHIERKDSCNNQDIKNKISKPMPFNKEKFHLPISPKTLNDGNMLNNSENNFRFLLKIDPKALKNSKIAFNIDDTMYDEYNEELLDEIPTDSDSSESLISVIDPLRLFGVLVPNTLKESQMIFKEIVNLTGRCATIQGELAYAVNKYSHLQKVKILIEAAANDSKIELFKPKIYWIQPSSTSTISNDSKDLQSLFENQEEETVLNIEKSIRSVFYEFKNLKSHECDSSEWSSENTDFNTGEISL